MVIVIMLLIVCMISMTTLTAQRILKMMRTHSLLAIFVMKVSKLCQKSSNTIKLFIPAVSNTVSDSKTMLAFMVIIAGLSTVNHSENLILVLNVNFVKRDSEPKIS